MSTPRSRVRTRLRSMLAVAALVGSACNPAPSSPTTVPDPANASARSLRAELVAGGVSLSWNADAAATQFEVQWQRAGEPSWNVQRVPARSTTITGLTPSHHYLFRVRTAPTPDVPIPVWSGTAARTFYSLTLPVLSIDTGGAAVVSKDDYVDGSFRLDANGASVAPQAGTLEMKGRGNTTWDLPKKPYRLKLTSKAPLMDLPSSKHWVLLANYWDRSQLRTSSGQQLASMTSLAWAPKSRTVELVLNGEYQGPYQLIEQVRVDKGRVDIDAMKPTDNSGLDVTGGYLFEIDFRGEGQSHLTSRGARITVNEPEEYTPQQKAYVESILARFEAALFSPTFETGGVSYRDLVNLETLVDSYLIAEFTMQVDAFYTSTFFYKERGDERFHFGPMWDFDVSQAPVNHILTTPWPATLPWVKSQMNFDRGGAGVWLKRMFQDPVFVATVRSRWQQLKTPFLAHVETLDEQQAPLMTAIAADGVRWNRSPLDGYNAAVNIQGWMRQRWHWMNATV